MEPSKGTNASKTLTVVLSIQNWRYNLIIWLSLPPVCCHGQSMYPAELKVRDWDKQPWQDVNQFLWWQLCSDSGVRKMLFRPLIKGVHDETSCISSFVTKVTSKQLLKPKEGLVLCKVEKISSPPLWWGHWVNPMGWYKAETKRSFP